MSISDNKRIAKNTMALYVRMAISMIVSLYTSRVILEYLGVTDYGVYSVVGGITSMFSFINSSMSNTSARYLSAAIAGGDAKEVNIVFNSSLIIHLFIVLLFVLFAETIGLWFVLHKLLLPHGYHVTANIVYQFTIGMAVVSIMQTPYNAMIISQERMSIYAYIEILNVLLKLGVVFLLSFYTTNRLEIYAGLLMLIQFVIFLICFFYCRKRFADSKLKWLTTSSYIRPMFSFSTWNLLGDIGYTLRQNGSNIVMNLFFGPVVNAANGIAMTVQGTIMALASNVTTALRPPIIKEIVSGNRLYASKMMESGAILSLLIMGGLIGPLIMNMNVILKWWLVNVPIYTLHFTNICLLSGCIANVSNVLYIGLQADIKIKSTNIVRFVVYLLTLPILYVLLKMNFNPEIAYWIIFASLIVTTGYSAIILKKNFREFNLVGLSYRILMLTLIASVSVLLITETLVIGHEFLLVVTRTLIYLVAYIGLSYVIVLNKSERVMIDKFANIIISKLRYGKLIG